VGCGWTPESEVVVRGLAASSGPTSVVRGSTVERWAGGRRLYLDNLKVLLIGAIIAGHAVAGYSALELWAYGDVREATLSPVTDAVVMAVFAPFGLFMVPLLFLIAGLLTPASLEHKGRREYTRDRLLRLGIPFAVFTLLIWPALLYVLYRPLGNAPGSYWAEFIGTSEEAVDTGYLWFVGDLLIFSLGYAGWTGLRRVRPDGPRRHELTVRHLLILAGAVAIATFFVRLVFPFDSQKYLDLNLYQWPECLAIFVLGVVASGSGWLTAVPDRLRKQCRTLTLVAVAGFAAFALLGVLNGSLAQDTWTGGWHVDALALALLESALSVFGPVWILGAAQHHLDRPLRGAGPTVARSVYGAFLLQGLVLIALAVALRPLPLPAEVKALIVAAGGVTGSFTLAWFLVSRVPGVRRIL
jgi:Acyltransferase family